MDCIEYNDRCLSAHADGELAPDELRAAEQHLAGCDRCRAALAAERALKARLRRLAEQSAPAATLAQIRRVLAGAAVEDEVREAPPARRSPFVLVRRPWIWIPAAIAAAAMIAVVLNRGDFTIARSSSVPLFDQATGRLAAFQSDFTPNVRSDSVSALQRAYDAAQMPSGIWNFTRSSFKLVGGRIETTPAGQRVTYTLYRGPADELILCMRFRGAVKMTLPKEALMQMAGHSFYRYRGMSLCVTVGPHQRFTCILATSLPIERFERIVAAAAVDHHS